MLGCVQRIWWGCKEGLLSHSLALVKNVHQSLDEADTTEGGHGVHDAHKSIAVAPQQHVDAKTDAHHGNPEAEPFFAA